ISLGGNSVMVPVSDRVLVADAILSANAATPSYSNPGNNYVSVPGGFQINGVTYNHTSPHIKGVVPQGGDVAYKDGHVVWHKFNDPQNPMTLRSYIGTPNFWW
ncbi:MAG TPA: hypothetical protein VF607_01590, partial [Verrucomicrobiae bacterium]